MPATKNAGRDHRRIFRIASFPNKLIEPQGGMTLDEAIRQCCEGLTEELLHEELAQRAHQNIRKWFGQD